MSFLPGPLFLRAHSILERPDKQRRFHATIRCYRQVQRRQRVVVKLYSKTAEVRTRRTFHGSVGGAEVFRRTLTLEPFSNGICCAHVLLGFCPLRIRCAQIKISVMLFALEASCSGIWKIPKGAPFVGADITTKQQTYDLLKKIE